MVQYKNEKGKTTYTLERRTDTLTSVDIAMVLASGGSIFNLTKCMYWSKQGKLLSDWIAKCNKMKLEAGLEGNTGKRNFAKLLANGAFGQSMKRDRNEA